MTASPPLALRDPGDVKFDFDLANGMVNIGLRAPLALEGGRVWVIFPLLDFLDVGAKLTLEMNAAQRRMMSELTGAGLIAPGIRA